MKTSKFCYGRLDLASRGIILPVINSDGNVWKFSVAEDKVSQEHLDQLQENCHASRGTRKKETN